MPRKGFKTVAGRSLPEAYVQIMEKIKKDPKFIAMMQREGHVQISIALVLRIAIKHFAEDMGYRINQISETNGK